MVSYLPLLLALTAGDSVPRAPAFPLDGGRANGAAVAVHRQPSLPIVSLRMSILAQDPAGFAGAGHLFQHLMERTLEDRVRMVGGRLQMERTSDAIAYTVTGPADELEHLAGALRAALSPPPATQEQILRASRILTEERLAEWEIAHNHVRAALRARLFPTDISPAGTDQSAARIRRELLPDLWAEIYRPERVSVVAVGDVRVEDVRRAFAELPAAPRGQPLPVLRDTILMTPMAPAEATRAWLGSGWLGSELDPVAVSVTARLLRDEIQGRVPDADVQAEHWWTHQGQALVLVTALPGTQMAAGQRAMNTAISNLQSSVTQARIDEAARAVRREMLFYTRTSDRMAQVIGRFTDRDGDMNATQRFFDQLPSVEVGDVREVLAEIGGRSPVRIEIPPQRLQPRRRT